MVIFRIYLLSEKKSTNNTYEQCYLLCKKIRIEVSDYFCKINQKGYPRTDETVYLQGRVGKDAGNNHFQILNLGPFQCFTNSHILSLKSK